MVASRRIAIVGGGPGGLMLARMLQLHGLEATVFERDAHAGERSQGGSLDLHGETGQRAMRLAGLAAEFAAAARPEDQGDRLYAPDGTLLFDEGDAEDGRPEIDRSALRAILLDSLRPGIVRWNARLHGIAADGNGYALSGAGWAERFDIVVGADGGWSQVRALLDDTTPAYEGATLIELGYEAARDRAVAALTGRGKAFAVGDNRALITQLNGAGHIRGYAGAGVDEAEARRWGMLDAAGLRAVLRDLFGDWASALQPVIETGAVLGVRPMYALPVGYRWASRPGVTLIGDAAHLMSPFAGEGVNLALADAVDLAEALAAGTWDAVMAHEGRMQARAAEAAAGSAAGLAAAFSPAGVAPVLAHYRERRGEPVAA